MWLSSLTSQGIKDLFNGRITIEAPSKYEGVIDYLIAHEDRIVPLTELMELRVATPNSPRGGKLASISTHISDGNDYATRRGYVIKNTCKHSKRGCNSTYQAIPLGKYILQNLEKV